MASSCETYFKIQFLIVWIALGIGMIVVGSMFINECTSKPFMPVYVLINGIMHLMPFLVLLVLHWLWRDFSDVWALTLNIPWFLVGSYYAFRNDDDDDVPLYFCNPKLYNFTLGIMITDCVIYIAAIVIWHYGSRIRACCAERCGCYERLE
ncbi:transmembrane protein 272-like [Dendropsophus ebraccatus]|uniref:transmembrane protein 272-like n=1 Tax=Dendropsophus ebraccatus TaxID=150705 RepID=UPI003831F1F6